MERDTRILIELCKINDRGAQRDLYNILYAKLFPMVRRYTNNNEHDVAEEIFNNGMLRVYKGIGSYNGSGTIEGWAYRIIKNSFLDHIKRNTRYKENFIFEDKDCGVDKSVVGNLSYKELLKTIHDLPESHRTVFNLFVMDGHGHKEIGEFLGITEGTSKWYLYEARRILKEKLEKQVS